MRWMQPHGITISRACRPNSPRNRQGPGSSRAMIRPRDQIQLRIVRFICPSRQPSQMWTTSLHLQQLGQAVDHAAALPPDSLPRFFLDSLPGFQPMRQASQNMRYDEMARRMLCRAFFSSRETCAWEMPDLLGHLHLRLAIIKAQRQDAALPVGKLLHRLSQGDVLDPAAHRYFSDRAPGP